jgi:hypothetical protein
MLYPTELLSPAQFIILYLLFIICNCESGNKVQELTLPLKIKLAIQEWIADLLITQVQNIKEITGMTKAT